MSESVETCIICFAEHYDREDGANLEVAGGEIKAIYFCLNCGHVWVEEPTGKILEIRNQESREYFWSASGRRYPSE